MKMLRSKKRSCFVAAICWIGCLFLSILLAHGEENNNYLDQFNVIWKTQSKHSGESMPVGGGDVACNVWVEKGEILFYLARTGQFDENNSLLKSGRFRIRTAPLFLSEYTEFTQELHLKEGYIKIIAKDGNKYFQFKIWTDIYQPVVRLEAESTELFTLNLAYENWRVEKRELIGDHRKISVGTLGYPGTIFTWPDSVYNIGNDNLIFFHRNRTKELLMWKEFKEQQIEDLIPFVTDPLSNLTFGGLIKGDHLEYIGTTTGNYLNTAFTAWNFLTSKKKKKWKANITMHSGQMLNVKNWEQKIVELSHKFESNRLSQQSKNQLWWKNFWRRSQLVINSGKGNADTGWRVGRNYNLFRYMMACNAYGKYPTKFNGGLLTTDPVFVDPEQGETPDHRNWGGGAHTAQNQRHLYWPLLKTGDYDFFKQQFDLYKNTLAVNRARTNKLWHHAGAQYTEYLNIYGIPAGNTYGWQDSPVSFRKRPKDYPMNELFNEWTNGHYSSQLEFAYMILQYHKFSGADITEYIPFIEEATLFFDQHYRYQNKKMSGQELDNNGKLVTYPSSALETYKNARNPTDVLVALSLIGQDLLGLSDRYINYERKSFWREFLKTIPEIPIGDYNGHRVLLPAETWSHKQNMEIPQLYVLFPFPLYGVGHPDLQLAIDTWKYGHITPIDRDHVSWMQGGIFTARMGLTDEAQRYAIKKLDDAPRRFPAFWGPGHDWVPDFNWGGSGMTGLQDMLLQETADRIFLFPAWPREWDVEFKFHTEGQSVVHVKLTDGRAEIIMQSKGHLSKPIDVLNFNN